jgi:hypothetical protein
VVVVVKTVVSVVVNEIVRVRAVRSCGVHPIRSPASSRSENRSTFTGCNEIVGVLVIDEASTWSDCVAGGVHMETNVQLYTSNGHVNLSETRPS